MDQHSIAGGLGSAIIGDRDPAAPGLSEEGGEDIIGEAERQEQNEKDEEVKEESLPAHHEVSGKTKGRNSASRRGASMIGLTGKLVTRKRSEFWGHCVERANLIRLQRFGENVRSACLDWI